MSRRTITEDERWTGPAGPDGNTIQDYFASGATRSYEWRVERLKTVVRMMDEQKAALLGALQEDLGKTPMEGEITELSAVKLDAKSMLAGLKEFMAPKAVSTPGVGMPCFSYVRHEPRGVVLIIGPFNYPVSLILGPLVGALAGGNCAVVKPSEMCPATSAKIAEVMPLYFPPHIVQVVTGGIPETTHLLKHEWDLIFFTGSERVGKIVAEAAAKTLTPVVLELGGKAPVFVDKSIPSLSSMADRIAWGKTVNCGQTCVAPDYLLCHEKHIDTVPQAIVRSMEKMYGKDPSKSDYARIVTQQHAQRLTDMIKEAEKAGTKVLYGGSDKCDPKNRFVHPTVLVDPPLDIRVMKEEIFGPILCVRKVTCEDEAIAFVKAQRGTPLALYVFTTNRQMCDRVLDACPSGGAVMNDVVVHFAMDVPFGGLGTSGYGNAHGKWSFRTFSHERAFVHKPCHPAFEFGGVRYAPYNKLLGGQMFIGLMNYLPTIPVLRTRLLLNTAALCVLTYAAANYAPQGVKSLLGESLVLAASALDYAAGWLRQVAP